MTNEKCLVDVNVVLAKQFATGLSDASGNYYGYADVVLVNDIENVPIVDAAEVVHAEWLDIVFDPMWRSMSATCSHCMVRGEVRVKSNECGFAVPDSDYCSHCGANMDGGINK